jgi:poly(A) polymerase
MSPLLDRIDADLLSGAKKIVRIIRQSGHEAFFAGGVVRDLLLGRDVSDIDLATSARPETIEKLFEKTIPLGKEFGVVIVVLHSRNYEVTTFRKESSYSDGRHPDQVSFSSANEDAFRRDFTVNALFFDPTTEEVIDWVGGRKDLEAAVIRTVGDPEQRFAEDRLRLMRAVRFAAELGFEIDTATLRAIKENAAGIGQVSQERIRDELMKMLIGPNPARALRLLFDTGILAIILPEIAAMDGVPQPPRFHPEGDVWVHTLKMFEIAEDLTETLALGILLHDVGKPPTLTFEDRIRFHGHAELGAEMAAGICRRFRLPNSVTIQVVDLVANHLRFMHVRDMRESTLKRFLRKKNFKEHLELHRLDCLGSHGDLSNYEFCQEKLAEYDQEVVRPAPLLNGHDLIALGLKPGPIFSEILRQIEDRQLEGTLTTKKKALEYVERFALNVEGSERKDK